MTIPPDPPDDQPHQMHLLIVEPDHVSETFVNSLRRWWVDGVNLHMDFVVNRPGDPIEPGGPQVLRVVTVARLVMPLSDVSSMHGAIGSVIGSLRQESPVKPTVEGSRSIN